MFIKKKSQLTHISSIVNKTLGTKPLFNILNKWPNFVGEIISNIATPLKLKKDILTIGVKTHTWLQELYLSKHKLLVQIQSLEPKIKDLHFVFKEQTPIKKVQFLQQNKKIKKIKISNNINDIEHLTKTIQDQEIKNIFKRILKNKI